MQASEHALLLVRGQFAFTIGMHIVLAAFTMGLANFLVVLEALWLRTRRRVHGRVQLLVEALFAHHCRWRGDRYPDGVRVRLHWGACPARPVQ
nr:cytochrome ubiquinol oxidase subunit I [Xanthomonas campestris pv. campestris]